jgi:NADH-quinone oxidoreductase subunit L
MDAGALGVVLGIVGVAAEGITAFYMFRLFFRAFWGPEPEGGYATPPHEGGRAMAAPVAVLAVGATFIGFLQVPGGWQLVDDWLEPTLLADPGLEATTSAEIIVSVVSVLLALGAIALAWWVFVADPARRTRLVPAAATRELLADQYRFDEVFEETVVQPGRDFGDVLTTRVERVGVEGSMEAAVRGLLDSGRGLRTLQSGLVRGYVFAMVAGAALLGVIVSLAVR